MAEPVIVQETASLELLREHAEASRLWAVIDACDAPAVPPKAWELGEERAVSLYCGDAEENYWAIAPYLFRVDEEVLEWIVDALWEEPWGIFAVSEEAIEGVRRHFRRFLTVEGPGREQLYFRFYDPRVLKEFLADDPDDARALFGEAINTYVLRPAGNDLISLRLAAPAGTGRRIRLKLQPRQAEDIAAPAAE